MKGVSQTAFKRLAAKVARKETKKFRRFVKVVLPKAVAKQGGR